MAAALPTSNAAALGVAVALLTAYPVGLLVLGFFKTSELREIRQFLANLRGAPDSDARASSAPVERSRR